jgi:NDP-sugar pyrophosphorylase family protein
MDYLLDRMQAAGCAEIRVVTRPEKRDVVEHSRARGATVLFARPGSVSESLLAGLEGLPPDVTVLFGFPDTLWQPRDGFVRLLAELQARDAVALGIFRADDPSRSDVTTLRRDRVVAIDVKPKRPRSDLVWGCAAARAGVLRGLKGHAEPGHYFDELARQALVGGVHLSDSFIDIGTPESLQQTEKAANLAGDTWTDAFASPKLRRRPDSEEGGEERHFGE